MRESPVSSALMKCVGVLNDSYVFSQGQHLFVTLMKVEFKCHKVFCYVPVVQVIFCSFGRPRQEAIRPPDVETCHRSVSLGSAGPFIKHGNGKWSMDFP